MIILVQHGCDIEACGENIKPWALEVVVMGSGETEINYYNAIFEILSL